MEARPAAKYIHNPNTIRWAATEIIKKIKTLLDSGNKVSYEDVIQPELTKLDRFKEIVPDIEAGIKDLETNYLAKHYPERFLDRDELFNQATNVDRLSGTDFDQVIPTDQPVSTPTPEELVRAKAVGLRRLGM